MVKRRDTLVPKKSAKELTAAEVEAFARGADGGTETPIEELDPDANRDYKSVRMNFNEFEHRKLQILSKRIGRTKMATIRWAVVYLADNYKDSLK